MQGVPFFCVFLACWSTLFIEMWQREAKRLAHRWGVTDYETKQEAQRIGIYRYYTWRTYTSHVCCCLHTAGFRGIRELDSESGRMRVVHYPGWQRWLKRSVSFPVLALFVGMCVYFMVYKTRLIIA